MLCGRVAVCAAAAAAFGCSGGGGDSGSGRTTLSVSLMDAPVDGVTAVYVKITSMWIKPTGGPAVQLPLVNAPFTVNLLELTDTNAAVLVNEAVIEPGSYEWLAMDIAAERNVPDSYVMTAQGGAEEIDMFVPSGRVRLVSGFEVGANQAVQLLFDWDMRQGLVFPPGQNRYLLKPAFRMIDVTEYGVLEGTIALETVSSGDNECAKDDDPTLAIGNVVYVFADPATPDDNDGAADAVATIDAIYTPTGYTYRTLIAPGTYTVVFTCQAGNDDPTTDETGSLDEIEFLQPVGTTNPVGNNGGVTTVNF
jgi:hypothetical protein